MSVIFADSSCDISEKFLKSHGVEVINLKLNINGKKCTYKADNFKFAEYYSNNNVMEYEKLENLVYEKLKQAFETMQDVVIVCPSQHFSPLYEISICAKKKLENGGNEQKIAVVDSGLISVGYASVVFETAIKNSTGIRIDDLLNQITSISKSFETLIIPSENNLGPLKKFVYGKSLGVKPLVSLTENKIELVGSVKGKLNLTQEIMNRINQVGFNVADNPVGVMHGKLNNADAQKIANQIEKTFETKVWSGYYFPMLSKYVGDNALIICFHKRND